MHLPSLSAGKLLSSRCSWPLEQVSGWDISSLFTEKPHCDIKMLFLLGAQVILILKRIVNAVITRVH